MLGIALVAREALILVGLVIALLACEKKDRPKIFSDYADRWRRWQRRRSR